MAEYTGDISGLESVSVSLLNVVNEFAVDGKRINFGPVENILKVFLKIIESWV